MLLLFFAFFSCYTEQFGKEDCTDFLAGGDLCYISAF